MPYKDPEKYRTRARVRRAANPEKYRAYQRAKQRAWRAANPEKYRARNLRRISPADRARFAAAAKKLLKRA